jgi:hypothetical protein
MAEQDIAAVCIRLSGGTTEHRPVPGGDTSYLLLGHAVGNYGNRTTCRHAFRISPAAFGLGDIRIKSLKEVADVWPHARGWALFFRRKRIDLTNNAISVEVP